MAPGPQERELCSKLPLELSPSPGTTPTSDPAQDRVRAPLSRVDAFSSWTGFSHIMSRLRCFPNFMPLTLWAGVSGVCGEEEGGRNHCVWRASYSPTLLFLLSSNLTFPPSLPRVSKYTRPWPSCQRPTRFWLAGSRNPSIDLSQVPTNSKSQLVRSLGSPPPGWA